MGLITSLRGLIGSPGPAGANGVVGLFVATFAKSHWSLAKPSSALRPNLPAGIVTVETTGWYAVNWRGAAFHTAGSKITLADVGGQCTIIGPLT